MKIILLRHGIAIDRAHRRCPPDPERYLTEIGVEKTTRACLGLRALGLTADALGGAAALAAGLVALPALAGTSALAAQAIIVSGLLVSVREAD